MAQRHDITKIIKTRDTILSNLFGYAGVSLEGGVVSALVSEIVAGLGKGVNEGPVFGSITYLIGSVLTDAALRELTWRLAGNITTLKEGRPVVPWAGQAGQVGDGPVPTQILDSNRAKSKDGKLGHNFLFCYLAGPACPLTVTSYWANSFCQYVARVCGFSAPWGKRPFHHPSELVGMRLYVEMATDSVDRPTFGKVSCPPSAEKWNISLIKKRRREGFVCPEAYDIQCHECWKGYAGGESGPGCPAACRKNDKVEGRCDICSREVWLNGTTRLCSTCDS